MLPYKVLGLLLLILLSDIRPATAQLEGNSQLVEWLRGSAISLDDFSANLPALDTIAGSCQVIGLGEATHGQHESFELKRHLTMYLVRHHQFRAVAYEASVSRASAANDYIAGRTSDRVVATKGLGMLIWQIEENAALLDDLRAWNAAVADDQKVVFVGVDAQDVDAVVTRLTKTLTSGGAPALSERVTEITARAQAAMGELMSGNREKWPAVAQELIDFKLELLKNRPMPGDEFDYSLCIEEWVHALTMYATSGGRDQAMAELLLKQLPSFKQGRCVLWAHNGHLQRSPLRYLGSEELAMGGHLAEALRDQYYAVGFAFGEGAFQANILVDGKWKFRRYDLSPAPTSSLEHTLGLAEKGAYLIDLKHTPQSPQVQQWLTSGHGQRWFGGYGVGDDCDQRTRDASQLLPTTPRDDFDALLYIAKTTAAQPLDPGLIDQPQP